MNLKIGPPSDFSDSLKEQIIELVADGEQVSRENIEYGLDNADQIAVLLDEDKIVTTATLKNPRLGYRISVFESANVAAEENDYKKELGYIATGKKYEGKKLCQQLLSEFMPLIDDQPLFATTRKPSMVHILAKHGFEKLGSTYKKDLELLARKK